LDEGRFWKYFRVEGGGFFWVEDSAEEEREEEGWVTFEVVRASRRMAAGAEGLALSALGFCWMVAMEAVGVWALSGKRKYREVSIGMMSWYLENERRPRRTARLGRWSITSHRSLNRASSKGTGRQSPDSVVVTVNRVQLIGRFVAVEREEMKVLSAEDAESEKQDWRRKEGKGWKRGEDLPAMQTSFGWMILARDGLEEAVGHRTVGDAVLVLGGIDFFGLSGRGRRGGIQDKVVKVVHT
jgi:hypothetical protein